MTAGEVIKLRSVVGESAQEVDDTGEVPFLPRFYFFLHSILCFHVLARVKRRPVGYSHLPETQPLLHPVTLSQITNV